MMITEKAPGKRRVSRGTCLLCGHEVGKSAMARHLEKCRAEMLAKETAGQGAPQPTRFFHLVIEGRDLPEYWLHLDARADATLADLDDLLRATWLECCGHLSAFTVGRNRYSWTPPGGFDEDEDEFFDGLDAMFNMPKEGKLDVTLAQALPPGTAFIHEYDFGSTTELKGRVLSEYEGPTRGRNIAILAHNLPPPMPCGECGEPSDWLGWVNEEDEEPQILCDVCIDKNGYSREMLLPVINSPRTGVCGYTGPSDPTG